MDSTSTNNGGAENGGCRSSSSLNNTTPNCESTTLLPKYAGLKGFKKFLQEMSRRKAGNISRELQIEKGEHKSQSLAASGGGPTVSFNDAPATLLVENHYSNDDHHPGAGAGAESLSRWRKANGDINSLVRAQSPYQLPSGSPQSKILDRTDSSQFINSHNRNHIDEESVEDESEEYECRCHLQPQSNGQTDSNPNPNSAPFFQNGHYSSIDRRKNVGQLPSLENGMEMDGSSSQSEGKLPGAVHHLTVTFDVISHPPPPPSSTVTPLSPNVVANAICPPPPLTNEPVGSGVPIKYQSSEKVS